MVTLQISFKITASAIFDKVIKYCTIPDPESTFYHSTHAQPDPT